jgi:hypothetical protein
MATHVLAFFITAKQNEIIRAVARGRPLKVTRYQWKTFENLRQRGIVAGNAREPELTEYGALVVRVMDLHARNMAGVSQSRRFKGPKKMT